MYRKHKFRNRLHIQVLLECSMSISRYVHVNGTDVTNTGTKLGIT